MTCKKDMLIKTIESREKSVLLQSLYNQFVTTRSRNKISFSSKRIQSVASTIIRKGVTVKGEGTGRINYIYSYRFSTHLRRSISLPKNTLKKHLENYYQKYHSPQRKRILLFKMQYECIWPTSIDRTPESIKDSLTTDQYKLYKLIWERFVAASMSSAIFHTNTASASIDDYQFKASGSTLIFDGFLKYTPTPK